MKKTDSDSTRAFRGLLELCAPQRGLQIRQPETGILETVNSQDLISSARRHRVTGLLYTAVTQSPELRARFEESGAFVELKKNWQAGEVFRNFVYGEWVRIYAALGKQNIPVVQIKGLSLSMELYGEPLARECRDLDILCLEPDLRNLVSPMAALGYRVIHFDDKLEEKEPGLQLQMVHHLVMEHPVMKLSVEIHNRLSEAKKKMPVTRVEDLFSRAHTMTWKTDKWKTLDPIDHAIYMISHGAIHAWCLLHWLFDLAVFWNRPSDYDWDTFLRRVGELGLERTLSLALAVSHHYFEFKTPQALVLAESLWDARLQKALKFVCRYLPAGSHPTGDYLYFFSLRATFWSALTDTPHPIRDMMSELGPVGYMQARSWGFPRILTPFYWPLKLFIVLFKAIRRIVRKIFHVKKPADS